MSKKKPADDYEVGYAKPPKSTRFRKGVSGNPAGRPKKCFDFDQQLLREARLPVLINENGRPVRISKLDVVLKQLTNKAMKGEMYATRSFLGHLRQALERTALLEAQQKDKEERFKDMKKLTDEELERILWDSLEEREKEEIRQRRSQQST